MIFNITDKLNPTKPLIPLDLSAVKYLILHHAEADNYSWEQCNDDHKANGWNCAGYNEYIAKNGDVYIMRGDNIGAQCQGYNSRSYGICCEGNYSTRIGMPPAQYNALMERVHFHLKRFPGKVIVMPHSQLVNTECPGKFFPMCAVLSDINLGDKKLMAALKVLREKQVVSSPEYWLLNAQDGKTCKGEYVRKLILNMANIVN
jgi:hypothetical protein